MQNGQAPQPQRPAGNALGGVGGPAGSRKLIALVVGVLVIVALVIGAMLFSQSGSSSSTSSAKVDTSKYQAIFLTNGQVYFGKLSDINSGYVNITDVYYLQVQQAVQPADTKTANNEQPKVSLTKLGNELHGPTDEMHISRDQVLFWENLKGDSTVVKAITDYKNKQ